MMVEYTKRPSAAPTNTGGTPAQNAPISLSKVTLSKSAPTSSLTKSGGAVGQMRVNLNWNPRPAGVPQPKGFLAKLAAAGNGGLDLDLGAMYELRSGEVGVIQALGGSFGSLYSRPYVFLDGDDRSGANSAGENLWINLAHMAEIKRILVFAYIYQGAPSWDLAQGVITLYPANGPQVEVRLDEQAGGARFCATAMLENQGGDLQVRREVRYIHGDQSHVDRAYSFGMRWTAGRK